MIQLLILNYSYYCYKALEDIYRFLRLGCTNYLSKFSTEIHESNYYYYHNLMKNDPYSSLLFSLDSRVTRSTLCRVLINLFMNKSIFGDNSTWKSFVTKVNASNNPHCTAADTLIIKLEKFHK